MEYTAMKFLRRLNNLLQKRIKFKTKNKHAFYSGAFRSIAQLRNLNYLLLCLS